MRRLLVALLVLGLLPLGTGGPAASAAVPSGSLATGQALLVPVAPVRLLDTRTGLGTAAGALGPNGVRDAQVVGAAVPPSATAVVLSLTALGATAASHVRAGPTPAGADVPPAGGVLTVAPGTPVAALVTVRIGSGGRIRLRNAAGALHLVGDLAGYYTSSGAGASLVAAAPTRLLDTRVNGGAVEAGVPRRLQVVGTAGAPAGTTAVVLTITALTPSAPSSVRAYPAGPGAPPNVSHLNALPGRLTTATVVVPVGPDGAVSLFSTSGRVHLLVDLVGRWSAGARTSVFWPAAQQRVLDTRPAAPLGPGVARDVVVAGAGVVPGQATAVLLSVTAVAPTAPSSDLRVYPARADGRVPGATSLTYGSGRNVTGAVLAAVGRDGKVRLRNTAGAVHLVVELVGWYGPSGEGWDISWPQCTADGATTTDRPAGGAFAVVGLTGSRPTGRPFTANACFAAQWAWANTLPGEPAVYMNLNAPGPRATPDGRRWAALCGTGRPTVGCARTYGAEAARFAVARRPVVARSGGLPVVWVDVEGPYPAGPFWQTGYADAQQVNRAVLDGAVGALTAVGYRVGIYSDRGTSPANDWRTIMGDHRLLHRQNWVFRSPTADGSVLCTPANSSTGGPVVMVQVQPPLSGHPYDANHLC